MNLSYPCIGAPAKPKKSFSKGQVKWDTTNQWTTISMLMVSAMILNKEEYIQVLNIEIWGLVCGLMFSFCNIESSIFDERS